MEAFTKYILKRYDLGIDAAKSGFAEVYFNETDDGTETGGGNGAESEKNFCPIRYIALSDSGKDITLFNVVKGITDSAVEFYREHGGNLFAPKAFEALANLTDEYLGQGQIGQSNPTGRGDLYKSLSIYKSPGKKKLPRYKVGEETVLIVSGEVYRDMSGSGADFSDGCLRYGTVIGDRVVSLCETDAPPPNIQSDGVIPVVGVKAYTHPAYRRKGYATSNMIALTGHLVDAGYTVVCYAESGDRILTKTALACGFKEAAREKTVTCVRGQGVK